MTQKKTQTKLKWWSIVFWLLVWEIASRAIGIELLLASPIGVVKRLFEVIVTSDFWKAIGFSCVRILGGFLGALILAVLFAVLSAKNKYFRELLAPLVQVIKSTPVASFILLILVWISPANISFLIALLMVFPIMYTNLLDGIAEVDIRLLEMAKVFRMSRRNQLRYIYIPGVFPFFRAGVSIALGMCWKSGIAAEIIGIPDGSIGEYLYLSKVYLETTDLFVWTMVIIFCSVLFERLFLYAMKIIAKRLESDSGKNTDTIIDSKPTNNEISGLDKPNEDRLYENQDIKQLLPIKNLNKAFGNLTVFKGFNSEILSGAVNAILGPSGGGKTTLLRILMGLEKADYDELPIEGAKYACVFQEDRLCGHLSAFKNIEMVRGSNIENSEILVALSDVGLKDHEFKPVRELSGGMKRRVAIIRALLSDYDILVLDEPFKGLDETLRKEVMAYVREKTSGKTVLFVTHEPEEVEAMGAKHSIFVNQLISR